MITKRAIPFRKLSDTALAKGLERELAVLMDPDDEPANRLIGAPWPAVAEAARRLAEGR